MNPPVIFDGPLSPPEPGMVLRICRWPEVFENPKSLGDRQKAADNESRSGAGKGYKSLAWMSCPVSFNSTGYQKTLDRFDPHDAAALYGCWQALCQLAAQSNPLRGRLCGEKGEPFNVRRIARLTGFSAELFEMLLPWCLEIQWLEWAYPLEPYAGFEMTQICPFDEKLNPVGPRSPADRSVIARRSPDDRSAVAQNETPDQTEPDRTKPNPTPPSETRERDFSESSSTEKLAADRPVVETPLVAAGCQSDAVEGSTEWSDVQLLLQQAGVQAASKCVTAARRNRWTLKHAVEVLDHAKLKRFAGGDVYERFQLSAKVAPDSGWRNESAEPKRDHLAEQTAAEIKRREGQRKSSRSGIDADVFESHKQRLRQSVTQAKSNAGRKRHG